MNNLYAMGAVPLAGQATVTLEPAADRILIERLAHTLAGAARQLADAKATLVGGHSAECRETGLGFAVTGTATNAGLLRKSGLHPGDHLILTKPLGTGVLFAADAEARLTAGGMRDVTDSMLLSNGRAAEIFAGTGVITCTGIGGFGLLGHLREMFGVAEVQIELWPDSIPRFTNTLELLAEGFESTMAPANAHFLSLVAHGRSDLNLPEFRLWLDPQTSGPLVAAVPEEFVSSAIGQLREAGFVSAAVIGRVIAGGSAQPFVIGKAPKE